MSQRFPIKLLPWGVVTDAAGTVLRDLLWSRCNDVVTVYPVLVEPVPVSEAATVVTMTVTPGEVVYVEPDSFSSDDVRANAEAVATAFPGLGDFSDG